MKAVIFSLFLFLSIGSFSQQMKLYAIRTNTDNTKDSFFVKYNTDSLFNVSGTYVQRSKEYYDQYYEPVYPNVFNTFIKSADNIWRNVVQQYESGEYTPTLFNTSNVDASSAFTCNYLRIGNKVFVSGAVSIDVTSAAATELQMTLPISSNLTATTDLGGSGSVLSQSVSNLSLGIRANAANDRASFIFLATSIVSNTYTFTFSYTIK